MTDTSRHWWVTGIERYMRRRYVREGATQQALSVELGIARRTVRKWLMEYGIPITPRHRTQRRLLRYRRTAPGDYSCDPRQLHKAGEPCQCGHVPPWAEAS